MTAQPDGSRPIEVQVFGVRKDAGTRKALRFFSERRVKTHFVDLKKRAASKGELTRFAQRFGIEALIDQDGARFASMGLRAAHVPESRWLEKLEEEPLLLRLPLVRWQKRLTVGVEEGEWSEWLDPGV